ncbi:MAG: hypothetical protein Q9212_005836 [Teloschistes hypoglaucus]
MPAYVLSQGALEPFEADIERSTNEANPTLTAQTRLYGTSLNCEQAVQNRSDPVGISYSNGKGCTTDSNVLILDPVSEYGGLYVGYYLDQHADYSLSGVGCPSLTNSHLFLAIWGKSWHENPEASVTALFCEPSYWTQQVNATLTAPSMNVSKVVPLGPRLPISDEDFNRTAIEYVIGTGAQAVSKRADISEDVSIINQNANLAQLGINGTTTNMIPFALGLTRLPPSQYADPHEFASSLEQAHKLLHALAVQQLMSRDDNDDGQRPGVVGGSSRAIIVIRPLTIVVECLLGFVTLLTLALLFHTHSRPSLLSKDPASLTDIIGLVAKDPKLYPLTACQRPEGASLKSESDRLLRPRTETQHRSSSPDISEDQMPERGTREPPVAKASQQIHGVRPIEMSLVVGVAFVSLLLLAFSTIIAVKIYANKKKGLSLPSHSALINQIVLNYIPIAFATFLEPLWLLLNRLLCTLQPFEALRHANSRSTSSLDLKYTSLPPQLIFWRAFRGRHYLLSAVCAIGLSANLLAISLNGLLETNVLQISTDRNLTRRHAPMFSHIHRQPDAWDYQYVAKANFSDGVALPPWTTPSSFFVPFAVDAESELGQVEGFRAVTQGFGSKTKCVRAKFNDTAFITGQKNYFSIDQVTRSGKHVTCGTFATPSGGQNKSLAAVEVLHQMRPLDVNQPDFGVNQPDFPVGSISNIESNATQEATSTCNSLLLAGFLRANISVPFNNTATEHTTIDPDPKILRINSVSSLWMLCQSTVATARYEVTVDGSGRVLLAERAGPDAEDLGSFFPSGIQSTLLVNTATSILTTGANTAPYWHNDTFTDSWFGYFIKHLSNSTNFVDPATATPVFEQVAPYVENLYDRLFAIVLSLNQDWLADADKGTAIPGSLLIPCQRVFVSRPMFIITATLLALNIVVAMAYWTWRPKRMLPQMPYTIASVLNMFHGSGLVKEVENKEDWEEHWKFGYGRFVGTDGKPHVGVERRPFVVPLDA